MSNYKDLAFTPQQKQALERFGESAEAYVLDKWFTPQQVRIIQLWSINHEQPENAHIFFNRIQCKYLTTLYKEVPSPLTKITPDEFLKSVIFKKRSFENYNETTIDFIVGPSYILRYQVTRNNNMTNLIFRASSYGALNIYTDDTWHYSSPTTLGGYNFIATDIDSAYIEVKLSRDGEPFELRAERVFENSQLKNGVDYGKPKE